MSGRWAAILTGIIILFTACGAWGVNSVDIPSLTVAPNQTDVQIPIVLENDVELRHIVCPLMIRSVSGDAYVTAVKLDTADRLLSALTEIVFRNHYNQGVSDAAECKTFLSSDPPSHGGFVGVPDHDGSEKQVVTGHPYGIMFVAARIVGENLAIGSDATGSFVITLDVNDQTGTFEIDTTCVDPANHLEFGENQLFPFPIHLPDFTKGVITIGTPGENDPPAAVDDIYGGAREGATLHVVGAGVLTNDTDADGDPLTAVLDTDVGHGTLLLPVDQQLAKFRVRVEPAMQPFGTSCSKPGGQQQEWHCWQPRQDYADDGQSQKKIGQYQASPAGQF